MNEQRQACLRALVKGRVQGVGFRFTVEMQATRLGLKGYVRNLPEGSVEVVAEGEEQALLQLLQFLRRGPRGAFVAECQEAWSEASGRFHDFRVSL